MALSGFYEVCYQRYTMVHWKSYEILVSLYCHIRISGALSEFKTTNTYYFID